MEKVVNLQRLQTEFRQTRSWERYANGDYLSDLSSVIKANALLSWAYDRWRTLDAADAQKWLYEIIKWMGKIDEERCDIVEECEQDHFMQVNSILEEAKKIFLNAWVQIAIKYILQSEKLQEVVHHGENISLFYYQQSSEKCAKMMFFSGLQVEMASFLQDICITTEEQVDLSRVRDVLHKYPPGSVFESSFKKQDKLLDTVNLESLTLSDVLLAKKTTKKFGAKTKRGAKHSNRFPAVKTEAVNAVIRRRTHSTKASNWTSKPLPNVAEKVKKKKEAEEEKVKASLLSEVAALWQPPSEKVEERHVVESEVDFDQEGFLGKTFHLKTYRVSTRTQINGIWMQHIDSEPEEAEPDCQFSLNIGLKVPVEEAFVGIGEPAVAFFDEQTKVWLKDVYTMNSHYDMNTSVVHVQISKFGSIALFQRTNFHFPYRKWALDFSSNSVSLMISTNFVELTFLFDQHTISVDVGSNIEFSKLKLINRRRFSLPEMARKLLWHGIYIFPSQKTLHKQFGSQTKDEDLEEYVCRYICTNGISCCSNRLSSTVPRDTIVIGVGETSVQFVRWPNGSYDVSGTDSMVLLQLAKRNVCDVQISSLFRWLMLTRVISLTK